MISQDIHTAIAHTRYQEFINIVKSIDGVYDLEPYNLTGSGSTIMDRYSISSSMFGDIIHRGTLEDLKLCIEKIKDFIDNVIQRNTGLRLTRKEAKTSLISRAFNADKQDIVEFLFDELQVRNDFAIGIPILHQMVLTHHSKYYDFLYQWQPIWLKWFTLEHNHWVKEDWYKDEYLYNAVRYFFKDFQYGKDQKLHLILNCLRSSSARAMVESMIKVGIPLSFEESFLVKNVQVTKKTILKLLATDSNNIQAFIDRDLLEYLPKNITDVFVF